MRHECTWDRDILTPIHKIGRPSSFLGLDAGSKDKAQVRFVNRHREGNDNAAKFETRYEQYCQDDKLIVEWYKSVVHQASLPTEYKVAMLISRRLTPHVRRKHRIEQCTIL